MSWTDHNLALPTKAEPKNALCRAFTAAVLLTASAQQAEQAVLNGIEALDDVDLSDEKLSWGAIEWVLSSNNTAQAISGEQTAEIFQTLPIQLQKVLSMPKALRYCYVMRVLVQMPSNRCASLLGWTRDDVDEYTRIAILYMSSYHTGPSWRLRVPAYAVAQ